jgi:hypothetical protein
MYVISIQTHLKKVLNHIIYIIFTDNCLVDFVMNFTLGNLTRRLWTLVVWQKSYQGHLPS